MIHVNVNDIRKIVFNPDPDIALKLNNLGVRCVELDDHQKAIEYYNKAYNKYMKEFKEKHSDNANWLYNMTVSNRTGDNQ